VKGLVSEVVSLCSVRWSMRGLRVVSGWAVRHAISQLASLWSACVHLCSVCGH